MSRRLVGVLVVVAALAPSGVGLVQGSEPSVVLHDWVTGAFAAGAPVPVEGVNAVTLPVTLDACHRDLRVDLLWSPEESGAGVEGVGEAAVLHVMTAQLLADGAVVRSRELRQSGFGHALGLAPAGDYELRVFESQGLGASWSLRLRGWEAPAEPECFPPVRIVEVELDPPGPDAGAEWVELLNEGGAPADVSGWSVGGASSDHFLPEGSVLAPGARLVVTLPVESLADAGEVVELRVLSLVRDASPVLTDGADDGRSWHRGAPWAFAPATPGS